MIEALTTTAGLAGMLVAAAAGASAGLLVSRTGKETRRERETLLKALDVRVEEKRRERDELAKECDALKVLKARKDELEKEARAVEQAYEGLEGRRKALDEWTAKEQERLTELETMRRARAEEKAALDVLRVEAAAAAARKDELEKAIAAVEGRAEEAKEVAQALEQGRAEARQAKAEATEAGETKARFETEITRAEERKARLDEEIGEREGKAKTLAGAREEAAALRAEGLRLENERTSLCERVEGLKAEIAVLEKRRAEEQKAAAKLPAAKEALDAVELTRRDAERRVQELERKERECENLESRIAALKEELNGLSVHIEGSIDIEGPGKNGGDPLEILQSAPDLWFRKGKTYPPGDADERSRLQAATEAIAARGLKFDTRMLHRFHTALKVSRVSALTVLAGISGTGKTQLPRAYAHAMGMNRLVVPVQPRWDGPRDLLGHFDFLHRRFQASELARLLYDYDQVQGGQLADGDHRMAIVLLDEMNLARPEYYFSEFLSRLELQGVEDERKGQKIAPDRLMELDVPYREQGGAVRLFPTQRVLWVGTMNEDESTMTLSDKVIDRANVIRFARPKALDRGEAIEPVEDEAKEPETMLHASIWNKWCRERNLDAGEAMKIAAKVNQDVMEPCGRSAGFRVLMAVRQFVERYTGGTWEEALAAQVEMRFLPKLEGVDALAQRVDPALETLAGICERDLNDAGLAESVEAARAAMQDTGTFHWTGRTFE